MTDSQALRDRPIEQPSDDVPTRNTADSETAARAAAPLRAPPSPVAAARGRSRLRALLMLAGIFIVIIGAGVVWLRGGRWVSTDNAYVHAAKLMVSTDISGLVSSVDVHEGQQVKAGDVLFRVEPRQFETALAAARAQLAQIRITLEATRQDYARLQSDIAAQQAQVSLAEATSERTTALLQTNATTRAAYDQARFTLVAARSQLESLQQQAREALTRLGGSVDTPVEQHPQYLAALAQVEEAQRQLDHTVVRAPFDGVVTAVDTLQPGTYLVAQTAALTNTGALGLVSTQDLWVDANLKETDLTYARTGDPVTVTIDAYPDHVWHGHIDTIAPASGSEFSLLPAQNSSGNWVKVVQRVPVRIRLDPDPAAPRLRSGMSAFAEIDTGHERSLSDLWHGTALAAQVEQDHGAVGH